MENTTPITIPEAALAAGFKRPSINVCRTWRDKGRNGVKLEAARIGQCYYTTQKAFNAWIRAAEKATFRADFAPTETTSQVEAS